MNSRLLLLSILFVSTAVSAQEIESKHVAGDPKLILKFSPPHLHLSNFPTLQFALEYQFTRRYSIQIDAGPSFVNEKVTANYFGRQRGYKTKLELRHYIIIPSKKWRIYYGPELYYNHVNYRTTSLFGVNCVDGNCDGFERKEYGKQYREAGLHLKSGAIFIVNRFCVDIHFGFAISAIRYKDIDKPDGIEDMGEGDDALLDFGPNENSRIGFTPTLGVRLGYVLKKN